MNAPVRPGSGSFPDKSRPGLRLVRWALPGSVLLLMPKCPACFAGYLAAGTGLGVSISTAATLRSSLLLLSVALPALFILKGTCQIRRRFRPFSRNSPS